MTALRARAWIAVAQFLVALVLMIFLPAWTLHYWQAWSYVALFGLSVIGITAYFLRRDPALIERRMNVGPAAEQDAVQRRLQTVASVLFIALFVVSGLDHHGRWSAGIDWRSSVIADVLVGVGFALVCLTFAANTYASGIVEVTAAQRVVSSGVYHYVRHPMYAGAMLLVLATPIALASFWALVPGVGLSAAIVARLLNEERYLSARLPGYVDYARIVRFRLVPGVW